MQVGFVGIGTMGWPMAQNILKGGHGLIVYDLDRGRSARFASEHAVAVATEPAQLARAECIVTMLPTGQMVREVYNDAPLALAQHLRPGTLAIDMSSSEPAGTRELGQRLAARGIVLIDAPVSGALPRAQAATLTIMIGGDDAAGIERAQPLLSCMGNKLFTTGGLGTAHAMKALNNFLGATAFSSAAEALLIGRRFGLDPARMLEIINQSTGRSFNTEVVMGEHVVGERFATGFALGLMTKDVKIAAALAREVHMDAPLAQLVSERFAAACDALGATRDFSTAILNWDRSLPE
jgi:3-hydroxyisobutyrate dehydrogenase